MTSREFISLYAAVKSEWFDPDREVTARAALRIWYQDAKLELDYQEQNYGFNSREAREARIRCNTIGAVCALFGMDGV